MIKVADVVDVMEKLAPPSLAEEWDNVGLLVGNPEREVTKIIVMLDLDEQGLSEALDVGADMIVTHHPFIMSKLSAVIDPVILKIIENKISVLSMHTNLDSACEGVNRVLAETVGLYDIEETELEGFVTFGGNVDKCTLGEFIGNVKNALGVETLRYVGEKTDLVSRVCVVGGAGADFIPAVSDAGFDVLLTADLKYHQAQLADKIGLCVIDAGHFETENPVIYKVARYLTEMLGDVDVITSLRTTSYIKYE